MSENLKILVIVSGYGLGNSERTQLYLKENFNLKNLDLTIIGSKNSYEYFTNKENLAEDQSIKIEFQHKTYYKVQGHFISNLFNLIFTQFPIIFKNGIIQWKIIKRNPYDIILIDSDYSAWIWKLFTNSKIFVINNSPWIINFKPQKWTLQFLFEWVEYYYFSIIATKIVCPVLLPVLNFETQKIKYWLCRNPKIKSKPLKLNPQTILVVLGGTNQNQWIQVLSEIDDWINQYEVLVMGTDQCHDSRFYCLGKIWGEVKVATYARADILLIHGGFSSVMESLCSQIPTLCLPLTDHHEQWVNAKEGTNCNHFKITNSLSAVSDLKDLIKNYSLYAKN